LNVRGRAAIVVDLMARATRIQQQNLILVNARRFAR
jgi:hypothetical protein